MPDAAETASVSPSTAIREYMDGKITSEEYFHEVRDEEAEQDECELREATDGDSVT